MDKMDKSFELEDLYMSYDFGYLQDEVIRIVGYDDGEDIIAAIADLDYEFRKVMRKLEKEANQQ